MAQHTFTSIISCILLTIAMHCNGQVNSSVMTPLVSIDSTNEVIAYYPSFSHIDLACGSMPSQQCSDVIFCAEAAFTSQLLEEFTHSNIDGDHVSGGKRYAGALCKDNSGAFTWANNKWKFIKGDYSEALDDAAQAGGMGFGQALIVYNGEAIMPLWRTGNHEFRALCEKDGRLCIVDSRGSVEYEEFVRRLLNYSVTHALYLDMGSGWNHSWWRDNNGSVHEIHPLIEKCRFCTNWITFMR